MRRRSPTATIDIRDEPDFDATAAPATSAVSTPVPVAGPTRRERLAARTAASASGLRTGRMPAPTRAAAGLAAVALIIVLVVTVLVVFRSTGPAPAATPVAVEQAPRTPSRVSRDRTPLRRPKVPAAARPTATVTAVPRRNAAPPARQQGAQRTSQPRRQSRRETPERRPAPSASDEIAATVAPPTVAAAPSGGNAAAAPPPVVPAAPAPSAYDLEFGLDG